MAEPTLQEKKEILKAYYESRGLETAPVDDMTPAQIESQYKKVMSQQSDAISGARAGAMAGKSVVDYPKSIKSPNVSTPPVTLSSKGKNPLSTMASSIYPTGAGQFSVPETPISFKSQLTPEALKSMGTSVIDKFKKIMPKVPSSNSNIDIEDPCASMAPGMSKASCYAGMYRASALNGKEDADTWKNLYDNALEEAQGIQLSDTSEFNKQKEQQRIIENIKTLAQQGTRDTSNMINNGIQNLNETLNKGIVMAPGQEYLFGQEPGGNREAMMKARGIDWKPTKFPTIPVDYMQAADYSAQENQRLQGNAIYPSSGEPIYPDKVDATGSMPKSITSFNPAGTTMTTKSGTQYAGQESKVSSPIGTWQPYQDDFMKTNLPLAKKAAAKTGLPIELVLAMTANETGWGTTSEGVPFGVKDPSGNGTMLKTIEGGERRESVEPFKVFSNLSDAYDNFVWEVSSPDSHWYGVPKDITGFLTYIQGGNPQGMYWADDTDKVTKQSTGQYQAQIEALAAQIRNQLEKKYDSYLPTPPPYDPMGTNARANQQRINVMQ